MQMLQSYHIDAFWDAEAKCWVATSEDVPGLTAEAATLELLQHKLNVLIPELLELNNQHPSLNGVPYELLSRLSAVAQHRHDQ
jgi:hypothetical protein